MTGAIHRPVGAVAIVILLAGAATASAAQRYASPSGTAADPCTQVSPCDIVTAINGKIGNMPGTGDEVIVRPGSYYKVGTTSTPLSAELEPLVAESIHGVAGQPRPVIHSAAGPYALFLVGPSSGLSATDLDIEQTATSGGGLLLSNATVDELIVHADGFACVPESGTITNSVCWTSNLGSGWAGLDVDWGGSSSSSVTLRNVDVFATHTGNNGIVLDGGGTGAFTLNATNVIARGGNDATHFDVNVIPFTGTFTANFSHSDYATTNTSATGHITPAGTAGNVTADPALADPAAGDFHETAASPTIDAGLVDPANGAFDFDGQARVAGALTDIGADELLVAPAVAAGPLTGLTATTATLTGTVNPGNDTTRYSFEYGPTPSLGATSAVQTVVGGVAARAVSAALVNLQPGTVYYWRLVATNTTTTVATALQSFTTTAALSPQLAPVITTLSLTPHAFRAATRGGSVARKLTPRGTVVSYTDSEAGTTTLTVERKRSGVKRGKTCVAPPRHPRRFQHLRHCKRVVAIGAFSHIDRAGSNSFRFTGRLRHHALALGSYLLSVVPRNFAHVAGEPRSTAFKIIR
jgi:hypothetical protein